MRIEPGRRGCCRGFTSRSGTIAPGGEMMFGCQAAGAARRPTKVTLNGTSV